MIEIYDSNLSKEDVKNNSMQIGCRGIVLRSDQILTVDETTHALSTLPGGLLEPGETMAECVVREVLEETGVKVTNPRETVRVVEHFQRQSFMSVYFVCELVEETGEQTLTEMEQGAGLVVKWRNVFDFMDIISNEVGTHPFGANIHNREFLGLINSL